MSDEVVIISPEIEAGSGGVADYTLHLVEEWGDRVRVRFVGSEPLPPGADKILLQYSAYGFDRIGYPRALLRQLLDWKKSHPQARLVVMLHEIWAFWPWLNKNRFVQWLHQRDLAKLLRVADAIFTSTPSQAGHLRGLSAEGSLQVMPVGSNIRPGPREGLCREDGLVVLFGLAGSRLRALRSLHAELKALGASGAIRKLITAGKGTAEEDEEERAFLSALPLRDGFAQRRALAESEISQLLFRASFGLSAQDELSVTKSGTFMAYAAHGLNILSPYGDSLGAEPICWLTRPREVLDGIAPAELQRRAESLQAWQERTASWPQIAARFAEALKVDLHAR